MSLARVEDNVRLAERITRSTNFQNQVTLRDFAALDELQPYLARQLQLDGVHYHYLLGQATPPPDACNFTLPEATTACALLDADPAADLCARLVADPDSLWSKEWVYPDTERYRSRYERIFRAERSGRAVWRTVQAQRVVLATLPSAAPDRARQDFYTFGRWLLLRLVLLRLRPEHGELLTLTPAEITALTTEATTCTEALLQACQDENILTGDATAGYVVLVPLGEVFAQSTQCRKLRGIALRIIAQAN
jgi:hypothetical protein